MGIQGRRARPLHVIAGLALLLALTGLATACGGATEEGATATPSSQATPMTLKVMEFNIEYGGTTVDFDKVVEAVKAASPDVVGLEEAETNTSRLAKAAGYPYWSNAMQVVSRYPLLEPPDAKGSYIFVQLQPGVCVALSNVHLPSDAPGPTMIRKGKTAEQVIAMEEKVRLPFIQGQLQVLPPLAKQGIPVFLIGDFNAPSHLDYTAAVAGTRDYVKYALDWPVSKAVEAAGFVDSWRAVYPDPLKSLGLTWWAARPKVDGWNPGPNAPQDRIDFIYSAGPAKATAGQLAGEKAGPEVDLRRVTMAVGPSRRHGHVRGDARTAPGDGLGRAAGGRCGPRRHCLLPSRVWRRGRHRRRARRRRRRGRVREPGGRRRGRAERLLEVPTQALDPGDYELLLVGADDAVQARAPFWVQTPGAKPVVTTDKSTYSSGEPIAVTWKNAPANRWDWLGVYEAGADDPNVDSYLIWQYTGGAGSGTSAGTVAGSMTLQRDTVEGEPWPLPAGKYVLYYLLADGYDAVASASFTVTE